MKKADAPILRLIRDKSKMGKAEDMTQPREDDPYDPAGDPVEYENDGAPVAPPGYDPDVSRLSALWGERRRSRDAAEWAEFCREYPNAAKLRRVPITARLTKPGAGGAASIPPAIVQQMLIPGWVDRSQAEILEAVGAQFPGHTISKNIWTYVQADWQQAKLRRCVAGGPIAFQTAMVDRCRTLAEFRRALQAHALTARGSRTYNARITISDEGLTINEYAIPYSTNTVKGKVYRGIRLSSVEPLLQAIEKGRKPLKRE